jgi:CHAT domain-containing protein/tetratricopeptide (TPR) repeat protein
LVALRRFDQAEQALRRVIEIRRRTVGEQHLEYGLALAHLGHLFYERGDLVQAGALLRRSVEVVGRAVGTVHPEYEFALVNLALVVSAAGDFLEARDLWSRVAAIEQATPPGSRVQHGRELEMIGTSHIQAWDYSKAEATLRRAVEFQRSTVGEAHPRYADALDNLGLYYMSRREPMLAKPIFARAVRIRREAASKADSFGLKSLLGLTWACTELGEYDQAEPRLSEARALLEANPSHPSILAGCLSGLARLYLAVGDQSRANRYHSRAVAVLEASGQGESYRAELVSMAAIYQSERRYDEARRVLLQVLELRRQLPGDQRLHVAALLQHLGEIESEQGAFGPAEHDLRRALAMIREVLGERSARYAYALESLGSLAFKAKDFPQAGERFVRAAELYSEVLGGPSEPVARCRERLGLTRWTQGELDAAEAAFRSALTVQKSRVGEWHPQYAQVLDEVAAVKRLQGHPDEARALVRTVLEIYRRLLDNAFGVLTERQQLAMTRLHRSALDESLSIRTDVAAESAYEPVLTWKGSVFSRQRLLRSDRKDPALSPRFQELLEVSIRLASVALRGPDPGAIAAWQGEVARLTERKERLESEVARRSPSFAARRAAGTLTSDRLRDALPDDAALVDFLEYTHSEPLADHPGSTRIVRRLVAFVLRRGRPVRRIELGLVGPIEAALRRWAPQGSGLVAAASELKDRVWNPLVSELDGARLVLVSPDGVVARIPFPALPGSKPGTFLIEERAMATVAVPHDLPALLGASAGPPKDPGRLVLVGDVDYDADPGAQPAAKAATAPGSPSRSAPRVGGSLALTPLPGTATEIESIGRIWSGGRSRDAALVLRRAGPSEAAIRRSAPGAGYLHLATHGYFSLIAPSSPAERPLVIPLTPDSLGLGQSDPLAADPTGYHPGLLSGIALVGANRGARAVGPMAEPGDDGVLTALEVAELDLAGTQLVVLSACETGLGRPAAGEGLLGLQRAFAVAGARTVIASLWQVDDQATATLMGEFYRNLWEKELGKLEALRQAQLTMLRHYDPGKGRIDRGLNPIEPDPAGTSGRQPRYWAGFALSGDWR